MKKKKDQNKNLKQIDYGYTFTKELDNHYLFQIAGDITINVNQLMDQNYLGQHSSWNEFIQVRQAKTYYESRMIDIYMDTDIQMRSDLSLPLLLLRTSQRQDLFNLANVIEEFQKVLNEKQKQDNDLHYQQQIKQMIQQSEPLIQFNCDELNGWNFQKSTQKAENVINNLQETIKTSDNHYSFILFKGNKYDQSISRLYYSNHILTDFLCLNEDQLSYISFKKPTLFLLKYQHQLIAYLIGRIKNQIRFLKKEDNDLDQFRSGLKLVSENTINIQSIDNISVEVQHQQYLYVLSNYKNQVDDVLWLSKIQPINNQSASQVLKGIRDLKKYLNKEQENSILNHFFNGDIYSDVIYEARAELFKDKFYSIIDNNLYHQVLENF